MDYFDHIGISWVDRYLAVFLSWSVQQLIHNYITFSHIIGLIVDILFLKNNMDPKQKLDELNKETVKQFEEYLKSKGQLKDDEHLKVVKAREDWQTAWNKFMETLMVLERLEI